MRLSEKALTFDDVLPPAALFRPSCPADTSRSLTSPDAAHWLNLPAGAPTAMDTVTEAAAGHSAGASEGRQSASSTEELQPARGRRPEVAKGQASSKPGCCATDLHRLARTESVTQAIDLQRSNRISGLPGGPGPARRPASSPIEILRFEERLDGTRLEIMTPRERLGYCPEGA